MWNSGAVRAQGGCAEPCLPECLQEQQPLPLGHLCPRRPHSQGKNNPVALLLAQSAPGVPSVQS